MYNSESLVKPGPAGSDPTVSGDSLERVLTFWPLVFYGMSVIVGAGIYVALEAVMQRAGDFAPLSFMLAGLSAGLTGICYAELASRYPQAAGAAAYVKIGFRSRGLCLIVAAATTLAAAIAAAAIAHGAVEFLVHVFPVPPLLFIGLVIVAFTGIAVLGVRSSVGFAAIIGTIEVLGLIAAMFVGLMAAPLHWPDLLPGNVDSWRGALAGAFIAFFAFIGFETLANMAEETRSPRTTAPLAILVALAVSLALYVGVAFAAVMADQGSGNPLLRLFSGAGARHFAVIAFLAVANGVLVEILMLSRLFYGMAKNGQLPARLSSVSPRTHAPVAATLCAGAIVLTAAIALPFQRLLVVANALTLGIFLLVDLALVLVQAREPGNSDGFVAPRWAPPVAALMSAALLMAELLA